MDRLFSLSDTQAGLLTEPVLPSFIIFNPKQLYSMLLLRTSATLLLGLSSLQASPVITEFLASNATGITDQNVVTSSWIAIHTRDTQALNLSYCTLNHNTHTFTFTPLLTHETRHAIVCRLPLGKRNEINAHSCRM